MNSLDHDDSEGGHMTPYFHTAGGASFALLFLAMLERFVNGIRGRLQGYWTSNALRKAADNVVQDDRASYNKLETPSSPSGSKSNLPPPKRTVPPFILAHDLPRGIVYMFQATLGYALMLAVMTFNAAYFVSVIMGLAIGEVMFGRWASAGHHH